MRATRPDIVRMRQPAVVSFVAHSGMVRVPGSNGNSIPLTLTLSPREREQPAAGSVVREVRQADTALGCAEGRGGFSLSPRERAGVRGKVMRAVRTALAVPAVCLSPEGPYGFEPFILSCLWLCRRSLTGFRLRRSEEICRQKPPDASTPASGRTAALTSRPAGV